MTNDDKQFFRELISDLRTELKQDMSSLRTELKEDIRQNGIMLEGLKDKVQMMSEDVTDIHRRLKNVEKDVVDIKRTIFDYSILREAVKKHSRQLAKLS